MALSIRMPLVLYIFRLSSMQRASLDCRFGACRGALNGSRTKRGTLRQDRRKMACLGATPACFYLRAPAQRPMETLLHRGAAHIESARRRARDDALGEARRPTGHIQQSLMRAWIGTATLIAITMLAQAASAQSLKHGEQLLAHNCASCHAVGRSGDSPHKFAPPFRTLGQRYPIESLEEALGEGIISGHPDMPEFKFNASDVGAIIAYLKSIQQR